MMLRTLLRVAASGDVRRDADIHALVLGAIERIAVDVTEPNAVMPAVPHRQNPIGSLDEHSDVLVDLLTGPASSEVVSAASNLSVSLATVVMQLDVLINAMAPEDADPETESARAAVKAGLDSVLADVQRLVPFAQKLNEYASIEPAIETPKFPSLPKSVKPSAQYEVDKTPIVGPPTEPDDVDMDLDLSELDALLGEE